MSKVFGRHQRGALPLVMITVTSASATKAEAT
jgi:hypothetical protein